MADQRTSRTRYRANLRGEIDSADLYRTLAKAGNNPDIAKVYAKLASIEEAHAEFWKSRLRASGSEIPNLRPGIRTPPQVALNSHTFGSPRAHTR